LLLSILAAIIGFAAGIMVMARLWSRETMFGLDWWTRVKPLLHLIYRYESPLLHNGMMVLAGIGFFLVFFMVSLWIVELSPDAEWVRAAHSPYVYAAFGFGIYFLLVGRRWTRVILVAAVPLAVRVIITLKGYIPMDDLSAALVFGAYDVTIFAIGAVVASALVWLRARRRMGLAR
jgi:hypothetical protein